RALPALAFSSCTRTSALVGCFGETSLSVISLECISGRDGSPRRPSVCVFPFGYSVRISRTFWRNVPTCYPVESNSGRDGSPRRPSNCVFLFGHLRQNESDVLEKRPYLLAGRIQLR